MHSFIHTPVDNFDFSLNFQKKIYIKTVDNYKIFHRKSTKLWKAKSTENTEL